MSFTNHLRIIRIQAAIQNVISWEIFWIRNHIDVRNL